MVDTYSPPPGPVVHIAGAPGVGKKTVAARVAQALNGRLIDNHVFLEPAFALFEVGSPEWLDLADETRRAVYAAAARVPAAVPLVFTNVLFDYLRDLLILEEVMDVARRRGSPFLAVAVAIDDAEHERRVTDPARGPHKLTDWPTARRIALCNDVLRCPSPAHGLDLDVSALAPEAACARILAALDAATPLAPAG